MKMINPLIQVTVTGISEASRGTTTIFTMICFEGEVKRAVVI